MSCFIKFVPETSIRIPGNHDRNGVTFYDIAVSVGPVSWTVQHRYREFVDLNEKLVVEHSIAKDLLPKKKVNNNGIIYTLDVYPEMFLNIGAG